MPWRAADWQGGPPHCVNAGEPGWLADEIIQSACRTHRSPQWHTAGSYASTKRLVTTCPPIAASYHHVGLQMTAALVLAAAKNIGAPNNAAMGSPSMPVVQPPGHPCGSLSAMTRPTPASTTRSHIHVSDVTTHWGASLVAERLGITLHTVLGHRARPRLRPEGARGVVRWTVGLARIELATSALSVLRSNRLSYSPNHGAERPGFGRRASQSLPSGG